MPTPVGSFRTLTASEILVLQRIFGGAINYSAVKIHNKKWVSWRPDNVTMTPNGEIYFNKQSFLEDYVAANTHADIVYHFIHEMVHVWQYQLGFPVKTQGFASAFKSGYNYTLKPDSKLSNYPMEAQANIIADWAMYLMYGMAKHYSGDQYGKTTPYTLTELQAVLVDFIAEPKNKKNLPIIKDPRCEAEPASVSCLGH
ncbi:MAG: hypothetical protein LBK55_05105 [Azoarcus sp.]|jgi:hypothetical protein|nr:hypothetical protein [Azoarcus sp.]